MMFVSDLLSMLPSTVQLNIVLYTLWKSFEIILISERGGRINDCGECEEDGGMSAWIVSRRLASKESSVYREQARNSIMA